VGGDQDFRSKPYPQAAYLLAALGAARGVDAGAIAAQCGEHKQRIPDAVYQARVGAVKASWR
jgi:tRNA nucleotidyltransferase (CCA-adding enzyme)